MMENTYITLFSFSGLYTKKQLEPIFTVPNQQLICLHLSFLFH